MSSEIETLRTLDNGIVRFLGFRVSGDVPAMHKEVYES
jgi:hypothetical protein